MRTCCVWSLATALSLTVVCGAEVPLWERRTANAVSRGISVSEAEFSEQLVAQICKRALDVDSGAFLSLAILTDAGQRFDLEPAYHVRFQIWMKNCRKAATTPVRAAVLVRIGGDAAVKVRNGLDIKKIVLAGKDPFCYRVSRSDVEIHHVYFDANGLFPFLVYARCSEMLSLTSAEELYHQLRQKLSGLPIHLTIRSDPWFTRDGLLAACWWVPIGPPNQQIVNGATQITCAKYSTSGPVCRQEFGGE